MANTSQFIVPHLWFDKQANEAAEFYTSIFPESKITNGVTLTDTPSGDANIVSFELWGQKFMAINGGPYFTFNPSISFFVNFNNTKDKNADEQLETVWNRVSNGGKVLMPLEKYAFSEKYGWIQDKFGVTWQLNLYRSEDERARFIPSLMFTGDNYEKGEDAIKFYLSVFKDVQQGHIARYPKGMEPDKEGTIMYGDFKLLNQSFVLMESARAHHFSFNEAISFLVYCDGQEEIDYYWDKLSAVPEAEQCGWLKDKYGVSWQIVPKEMDDMMRNGSPEQIDRMNKAVLNMKKLDLEEIQRAFARD